MNDERTPGLESLLKWLGENGHGGRPTHNVTGSYFLHSPTEPMFFTTRKGPRGARGKSILSSNDVGPRGPRGRDGPAGRNGISIVGEPGVRGPQGARGALGRTGATIVGEPGIRGPQGARGAAGPRAA